MNLEAMTKSELVKISRHMGAYAGDSERVAKGYFVDMLLTKDPLAVESAADSLGFTIPADDAQPKRHCETQRTVQIANGDPAAAMVEAMRAMMAGAMDETRVRAIVEVAMQDHEPKQTVNYDGVAVMVRDALAELTQPLRVELVKHDGSPVVLEGLHHFRFPALLRACSARTPDGHRLNIWITGPAGTGKTTAAKNVANALGLPFFAVGTSDNKYEVTGFTDANGRIVDTAFRRAYRDGGVILLDEVDGWFPNALLALNAATANGVALFPDGMIPRHPDCVIICAANTHGNGGITEYVGRMKQDAAFLDRFVFLDWPIDEALEVALSGNPSWCKRVQQIRAAAVRNGLRVLITPRATIYGATLIAAGFTDDEAADMAIKKGMTHDQWSSIGGAL